MIRLSKSIIGKREIKEVTRVLKKEYLGMGEEVFRFENELSNFLNSNVACVNSGTAALQLALQAIGIKKDDEVLVQSLTYLATFQAISALGAIPIPCEIYDSSFTIDLEDASKKITAKTKAIIPVHYCGNPGNLENIYKFAKKNNIRVIEDAAHAFGTKYKNKIIGSFGDIICFSFDGIKNITSGEGGAVVSKHSDIIQKVKDFRLLGVENDSKKRYKYQRSWDFDVKSQGWRYHMSDIMAAIGRVQLHRFDSFKSKRQKLAKLYKKHFQNSEGLSVLDIDYDIVVPHIFVIRIFDSKRDHLKKVLEYNGIQTGIHYKPNHLLSYYNKDNYCLKRSEKIYNEILTLPLHPNLKISDIKIISKLILNTINVK